MKYHSPYQFAKNEIRRYPGCLIFKPFRKLKTSPDKLPVTKDYHKARFSIQFQIQKKLEIQMKDLCATIEHKRTTELEGHT